jgi:SNW domain-containing protein 1
LGASELVVKRGATWIGKQDRGQNIEALSTWGTQAEHNKFSETLYIANRHSRGEVDQRALMQQKLAQKEEAAKENLRLLAQRAQEERAGIALSRPTAETQAATKSSLDAYGSDSGSALEGDDSEEEAVKVRDQMRMEKRREREREMRKSNMGTEQRAKMLARQRNRDISEKIALGLAKPTLSK